MLLGVVEDEIAGRESLDDGRSQRVDMHIYLFLVLLSVFTQMRANVVTESDNVKKELVDCSITLADMGYMM